MNKKYVLKTTIIGATCLFSAVIGLSGCGSSTKSTTSVDQEKTIVSFSISPSKAKYEATEAFVITMTTTGPEVVLPSYSTSFSGSFSGSRTVSGNTIVGQAGNTSGSRLILTCAPDRTKTVNGVPQIITSGNTQFVIETQ